MTREEKKVDGSKEEAKRVRKQAEQILTNRRGGVGLCSVELKPKEQSPLAPSRDTEFSNRSCVNRMTRRPRHVSQGYRVWSSLCGPDAQDRCKV
jgi:hypothetical protein